MDTSVIAVVVAIAIGIIQLVVESNKKKKKADAARRTTYVKDSYNAYEQNVEPSDAFEPVVISREHKYAREFEHLDDVDIDFEDQFSLERAEEPLNQVSRAFDRVEPLSLPVVERGVVAKPIAEGEIAEAAEEEISILADFTVEKAVLYSEVLKPKWN